MCGHRCLGKVGGLGIRYTCAREKEAHGGPPHGVFKGAGGAACLTQCHVLLGSRQSPSAV